jgi:protein-S-isoprenylcysteine O-methyltransferase Ste14
LILLIIKSNFEERLLLAKFSDYEAYQGRTGRFLPRIGK